MTTNDETPQPLRRRDFRGRLSSALLSATPLLLIAGLLYAGLFVKPKPQGSSIERPVFERGDRLYGVAPVSTTRAWVVGSDGKILRTQDGAKTWQVQRLATHDSLQDVATWDERRAVAVGNGGLVFLTSDAGASWQPVSAPKSSIANKLLRVRAYDGGKAWAVGEGGSVLYSENYGATWYQRGSSEDVAWNDVAFDGDTGWIVGEFGRIRRSSDGGRTWTAITSPVKSSLMGVRFRDKDNGVAVGLNGVILTTSNSGATWNTNRAPSVHHADAKQLSAGRAELAAMSERGQLEHLFSVAWDGQRWIGVGSKGVVVIGTMDGKNWYSRRVSPDDLNWYTAVQTLGDRIYISGSRVVLLERNDL